MGGPSCLMGILDPQAPLIPNTAGQEAAPVAGTRISGLEIETTTL